MNYFKILLLSIFTLLSLSMVSQEICDNGIDDDGDGLIDLNDIDDCACTITITSESFIPNPSFEDRTGCPSAVSQLSIADTWIQTSNATSDYFNTCDFMADWLLPIPDGDGVVGAKYLEFYKEYVGAELLSPLIANTDYSLRMNIISATVDVNIEYISDIQYGLVDVVIYGTPNASDLPFNSTDCPLNYGGGQWRVIGSYTYNPSSSWQEITIPILADVDIAAVTIGSPCDLPAGYLNLGSPLYEYFVYDNLILNPTTSTSTSNSINITASYYNESNNIWVTNGEYTDPTNGNTVTVGNICPDIVKLVAASSKTGSNQWYFKGKAILGATDTILTLNVEDFNYGEYEFRNIESATGDCSNKKYIAIAPEQPIASFDYNLSSNCIPTDINLNSTATFSGNITDWQWTLDGNGISNGSSQSNSNITTQGSHNIELIVESDNFCRDTTSSSIDINSVPEPNFTSSGTCFGSPTTFTGTIAPDPLNIVYISWNFGDGSSANGIAAEHTYAVNQPYTAQLTVSYSNGCTATYSDQTEILTEVAAYFTTEDICYGNEVSLTDGSNIAFGEISSWAWDFGDGNTSNSASPSHNYSDPDTYSVSLTVTSDNNCSSTFTEIQDVVGAITNVDFSTEFYCLGDFTQFVDQTTITGGSISSWSWNFNDGNISNQQNPNNLFTELDEYNIGLTITDNYGCTSNTSKLINIYPRPTAQFSSETICFGSPLAISNTSSIESGSIEQWLWDFGDGNTSESINPEHIYQVDGELEVTLGATSDQGCYSEYTSPILISNINSDFNVDIEPGCTPICGSIIDLSTSTYSEINKLIWTIGEEIVINDSIIEKCFENLSNTDISYIDVQLIASNTLGCKDTLAIDSIIEIWPIPIAEFESESYTSSILSPEFEYINTSISNYENEWEFGDYETSNEENPQHNYAEAGTYTTTLTVLSDMGCTDTYSHTYELSPSINIFVPNAFTPEGDGINDVLKPIVNGDIITEYEFNIFDRNGDIVFTSAIPQEAWNGNYNNNSEYYAMDGVYNWMLKVKFISNTDVYTRRGAIVLIR